MWTECVAAATDRRTPPATVIASTTCLARARMPCARWPVEAERLLNSRRARYVLLALCTFAHRRPIEAKSGRSQVGCANLTPAEDRCSHNHAQGVPCRPHPRPECSWSLTAPRPPLTC